MQTVTETPKTTTPAPAAAPAGPPTATEIADRVLQGIESAAGVAGTQVTRVWPEMVRARWAEGVATLALTCLLVAAYGFILKRVWAIVPAHLKANCRDAADRAALNAMLLVASIGVGIGLFSFLLVWALPAFAAVLAPEGQYVREIVRDALGKK